MRVLLASPEAVPFAKTGGLADVAGALLREFRERRQHASLVLPLYRGLQDRFPLVDTGRRIALPVSYQTVEARIFASDAGKVPAAYFIDCPRFFDRPELYGTAHGEYPDNAVRFLFFSRAVPEACRALSISPDVIHCNDWQTAMVPLYLKTIYSGDRNFTATRTVFTIHNLGYQGNFDASSMEYTGLGRDFFVPDRLEYYGRLNLMKAGIIYADVVTTVSPTYAQEVMTPEQGFGLDGLLRMRKHDLRGILNGLDYREWDPSQDAALPARFSASRMAGRDVCREALLKRAGFRNPDRPVFGIVSRLSYQKGIDLVTQALDEIVAYGGNIAILGTGEEHYHAMLKAAARRHRDSLAVTIGFEEDLGRLIYGGSDFFLMPSKYEPCGLGQMIAMRYGSIPVARATGGLRDTIRDYDHLAATGTGFLFDDYTTSALRDCVKRALCVFADRKRMNALRRAAMAENFSWSEVAAEYLGLYRKRSGVHR